MKKIINFLKIKLLRIRIVFVRFCRSGVYQYQNPNRVVVPFRFRQFHITINGKQNEIYLPPTFTGKINIHIDGCNNKILFTGPFKTVFSEIKIRGNNNFIQIGASKDASYRIDVYSRLASRCNNAKIVIGDNVLTSNQTWIKVGDHNSSIVIGDDTIISWDVTIWNVDGHSIFPIGDNVNKHPTNVGKLLKIGAHCWIGKHASILKNVELPDNTIVGMGAVVAKNNIKDQFCVLAGNPAKLVKKDVKWDIQSPSDFIEA